MFDPNSRLAQVFLPFRGRNTKRRLVSSEWSLIDPPDLTQLGLRLRSGNDFHGQKMAAEAAAGCLSALGKIVCAAGDEDECVGTDLPVLGGFLSGRVCERETERSG